MSPAAGAWAILYSLRNHFKGKKLLRKKDLGFVRPLGLEPVSLSDGGLLIATGLTLLLSSLLLNARLDTVIKRDGTYVRFFPFYFKYKHHAWETLTKSFVRQYSPLTEYGGWGLRLGLFGSGRAFNVSGDQGLQLQFTNDNKLLIGTEKAEELEVALRGIGQLKG